MLHDRGVFFGNGLLPTYAFAFVTPIDRLNRWAEQANLVIAAAEYRARQLVAESESDDTHSFGRDLNELIYTNPGYERICVLCRPDGVVVGSDLMSASSSTAIAPP